MTIQKFFDPRLGAHLLRSCPVLLPIADMMVRGSKAVQAFERAN